VFLLREKEVASTIHNVTGSRGRKERGGYGSLFSARHLGWGALGEFRPFPYGERLRDRHLSPFQRPRTCGEGQGRVRCYSSQPMPVSLNRLPGHRLALFTATETPSNRLWSPG